MPSRPTRNERRALRQIRDEWNALVAEAQGFIIPVRVIQNVHSTQTRPDGRIETGLEIGSRRLLDLRIKINRRRSRSNPLPHSRALESAALYLPSGPPRDRVLAHLSSLQGISAPASIYDAPIRPANPLTLVLTRNAANAPPTTRALDINDFPPRPVEGQRFGVEFEFLLPNRLSDTRLAMDLTAAGIETRTEEYTHRTRSWWKIVPDRSVSSKIGGIYGRELVSPAMKISDPSNLTQIGKLIDIVREKGCIVNQSCGLHVHVGAKNRAKHFLKRIVEIHKRFEPIVDLIVGPSRRDANTMCKPLPVVAADLGHHYEVDDIARVLGQLPVGSGGVQNTAGRYYKLNLQAYYKYGTVEFRQHQGTLIAKKALSWIKLCLAMAEWADAPNSGSIPTPRPLDNIDTQAGLNALLTTLNMGLDERVYFEERRQLFVSGEE